MASGLASLLGVLSSSSVSYSSLAPSLRSFSSSSAISSKSSTSSSSPSVSSSSSSLSFDSVNAESRLPEEQQMTQVIFRFVFRVENTPSVRRRRAAQLGTPKVVLHLDIVVGQLGLVGTERAIHEIGERQVMRHVQPRGPAGKGRQRTRPRTRAGSRARTRA